ncbi:MAG TPA: hypothetical protein VJK04_02515 [Candidatus Paceibacterota bacterium]
MRIKNTSVIEKKIIDLYKKFFKVANINHKTGELGSNKKLKFATYPYIGSKYGKRIKVLFIGLDIGKDEKVGSILGFTEKRKIVEGLDSNFKKMNPHIAGTYVSTICFFKNNWGTIRGTKSYKGGIIKFKEKCNDNLLSYISFTNLHKFVTKNRKSRSGGKDREYIWRERELKLLTDEIWIFKPDILLFQSKKFSESKYVELIKQLRKQYKVMKIYIAPHPSYRGIRAPQKYKDEWETI